jgi:diphthine synthase
MVLFVIGLGLGDERDVTVKGLEAVKSSVRVFLEEYTAILGIEKSRLESFYGKSIITADRELVESNAEMILNGAKEENIAFLVVGDPFAATTHSDLFLRAVERDIPVQVIHNASIMNAIGCTGLQLYNFGQTVSIPFFHLSYRPDSFYPKIATNLKDHFHTLCLLDIKVKEQTPENLARGVKIYEPPRFMTINNAIQQLMESEEKRQERWLTWESLAVGVARVGQNDQRIVSGSLRQLASVDFGPPLHSLVICGEMHELELEMFEYYHIDRDNRKRERLKKKEELEELMELNRLKELEEKKKNQMEWNKRKEENERKKKEEEEKRREEIEKKKAEERNEEEEEGEFLDLEPL